MTTIFIRENTPLPERREFDVYETEPTLAETALDKYCLLPEKKRPYFILDPGAGSGSWGSAARKKYPNAVISGVELRNIESPSVYDTWYKNTDFINFQSPVLFDVVIGNPPYGPTKNKVTMTERFVKQSWGMLRNEGLIIFLLPLSMLTGEKRLHEFWSKYPLFLLSACARRPSFSANGKTNGTSYGIFIWKKGFAGVASLDWLNYTR